MQDVPSKRIHPSGLINPKADAAKATMQVLKEMAAAKWLTPTDEERAIIASFDLPEHLRRDSAIPYELLNRASAERVQNWYDEDRLLRELFSGERGDTLIRAFKNFFPRISAGDFDKAWEHISLISDQLPDMLAQIKYKAEFIDALSNEKREECGELFVECFRTSLEHYLNAHIAKLKQISIDEALGSRIGVTKNPSPEEIGQANLLAKSKIDAFFAKVDDFHETHKDSVYTRLTSVKVDPRALMPNGREKESGVTRT